MFVCIVVCSHQCVASVNVCCVCVVLCFVLIHTLTHGVLTHICCKMMVQSIFATLHFNTFLTHFVTQIYTVQCVPSRFRSSCG